MKKRVGRIVLTYPDLIKDGDLAELIGVILGDGHICAHARCESLRIVGNSNNPAFANRYADIIEKVFNKKAAIYKKSNSNALTITIYQKFLSKRLGIPSGSRSEYNFQLPNWIDANPDFQIRFLRGLYEAEGFLTARPGAYTHKFIFTNKNMSLNNVVLILVTRLGFHPHYSADKVQVSRKGEVQNLANLLQFRHYTS